MRPSASSEYESGVRHSVAKTKMDKLLELIGWIGIALFVLIVGGFVLVVVVSYIHAKCKVESEEALRSLVPIVRV